MILTHISNNIGVHTQGTTLLGCLICKCEKTEDKILSLSKFLEKYDNAFVTPTGSHYLGTWEGILTTRVR